MFITNDTTLAKFYLIINSDIIKKICLDKKQYYIYTDNDKDILNYHPSEYTYKKIKKPIPNIGIFEKFDIKLDEQLYLFNFDKGVVCCNLDSVIKSDDKIYVFENIKETIDILKLKKKKNNS